MSKIDRMAYPARPIPISEVLEKGEDRRIRGERLWVSFPITATHRGNPINGFLEAMNLSWSGMMIATNFPLNVGDEISLKFMLPDHDVPVMVQARVVHKNTETRPEEATYIGVRFIELEPNVQRMLAGFVLEHLPTS